MFSNAAKKVFQQIPRHIRGTRRQNAAEKAAARSNSKISVPEIIKDIKNKPGETLGQDSVPYKGYIFSSQYTSISNHSMQASSLAGYYMLVDNVEKSSDFNTIRLRFLYVLFFRLKQSIQPKRLCANVISLLVQIIYHSGLVKDSKDIVEKKLVTWTDRGERYELLAKDFGGLGSLFVLPNDIPESVYVSWRWYFFRC